VDMNLLGSVDSFAQTTLAKDIRRIASFLGCEPTGELMVKMTGTKASSLSRLLSGRTTLLRTAAHISVLAALTSELEAYLELKYPSPDGSTLVQPMQMRQWLISGVLDTDRGPMAPLEVLSDPDLARAALLEARGTPVGVPTAAPKKRAKGSRQGPAVTAPSVDAPNDDGHTQPSALVSAWQSPCDWLPAPASNQIGR
jgi:hypothetical protein